EIRDNGLQATPLIAAAIRGPAACVRLLLDHGADPHAVDRDGCTALLHAVSRGRSDIVRVLLDGHADPNDRGLTPFTPIELAARGGRTDIEEALEMGGAIAMTRDSDSGKR